MWLAFGGLSTNKTPTINSDKHFTLPTLAGLSFHSHASRLTQARSAAPQPSKGSSGSSRNPTVMNVAPSSSPDPLLSYAAEWPANLTDWDEIFEVSESFATIDIQWWTPLTNPEDGKSVGTIRAAVSTAMVRVTRLENCTQPFINASGYTNSQLGQLGDIGKTYRRWQRRMLSYRRPSRIGGENTRSLSSSHRCKTSSRRCDNNCRNRNGHFNVGRTHHVASQLQYDNGGGPQGGGPTANSLTIFQPQQGRPPAPSSGTQALGMLYGSVPNSNPDGRQPGALRTTDYPAAVRLNFPPRR